MAKVNWYDQITIYSAMRGIWAFMSLTAFGYIFTQAINVMGSGVLHVGVRPEIHFGSGLMMGIALLFVVILWGTIDAVLMLINKKYELESKIEALEKTKYKRKK